MNAEKEYVVFRLMSEQSVHQIDGRVYLVGDWRGLGSIPAIEFLGTVKTNSPLDAIKSVKKEII